MKREIAIFTMYDKEIKIYYDDRKEKYSSSYDNYITSELEYLENHLVDICLELDCPFYYMTMFL
ncbi:MAG: hypothetical protein U9N49_08205 [Campylobacterota bacterium]|nr:hypothetical protein [Campylobacterota bacterium]